MPRIQPAVPARKASTVRSLLRIYPYARPALPRIIASGIMAVCATICGLAFPLTILWIIDGPITSRDLSALWWPAIVLVALGLAEGALFAVRRWLAARPTMAVEAAMRAAIYDRLQRLPVAWHDHWPAGQLLSRAVSDLSTIRRFLAFGLVFLFVNLATFLVGVGILLSLSWQLGLIIAALAIPLVILSFTYESKYQVLARRSQDQVGDLATTVEESVLGIRILKAFGRSAHLGRSFLREAAELRGTELRKAKVISVLWAAIIALPEIALGTALVLGIVQVADGTLTAGTLVAFFGVAMGLRWPIDSIGWLLAMTNETATASDRFFEVMDAPLTVTSPEHPVPAPPVRGRVRFSGVRFHFADAAPGSPGPAARHRSGAGARRDGGAGRCHRVGQDHADRPGQPALRRHRRQHRAGRRRHPRSGAGRAAQPGGGGVRGADAVLRVGAGERAAGPAERHRRRCARGSAGGPGRLRRRSALGSGHQDR